VNQKPDRPRPKPKLRKHVIRVLSSLELEQVQGGGLCARVFSRYCPPTRGD